MLAAVLANAWLISAVLTGALVFTLQGVLRARGGRVAGLVAAGPITSLPALLWVGWYHGGGPAGDAASAGLQVTGFVALALLAWLHLRAVPGPDAVLAATGAVRTAPQQLHPVWNAVLAGALAGLSVAVGAWWSAAACGLVAALPWTGACMAVCAWRAGGPAGASVFMAGYARGMPARLVFFGISALLAAPLGATPAVLLGVVSGMLVLHLQSGLEATLHRTVDASGRRGATDTAG